MITPDPIDPTHAESMFTILRIREHVSDLRNQAAVWQPGPMPDEWEGVNDARPVVWRPRR